MGAVISTHQNPISKESADVIIRHVKVKAISGQFQIHRFQCKLIRILNKRIEFRLTWENKTRTNHGLLEIKHNGVWGTVCDDSVNVTQVCFLYL